MHCTKLVIRLEPEIARKSSLVSLPTSAGETQLNKCSINLLTKSSPTETCSVILNQLTEQPTLYSNQETFMAYKTDWSAQNFHNLMRLFDAFSISVMKV